MGIKDRLTGRLKQAAGDLKGDEGLRQQGVDEERKADAEEELEAAHDEVVDQAARVQDAERAVEEQKRTRG
jgi:uncharacterized protein YjbJ (UPF0337 family)